ncbi:single-stranded-DNA-specific exonuclease RecJ [Facilibium subflavum]|uniref:single-stranded-DNA-specific exonuclease RecJ n=1 Tax=Facilibium subflavum TaxID=2219058 RepID=UPI0013C327F3
MKIKSRPFHQEVYQYLRAQNIDVFMAKILARRIDDPQLAYQFCQLELKHLSAPFNMKNMDIAVNRLIEAMENGEVIGLETDHDCDGQTSHAILYEGLTRLFCYPASKVRSYIGHRMKEGYGLSDALALRILSDAVKPDLIITADNGSTDEPRIALLKKHGIDTIVTDHHAIPEEGVPKSACAVLNPTQEGCNFGDPYIAGCMVAWLLMAATRQKLKSQNKLPQSDCQLIDLLDFVAVGTVADCVSMAKSVNNRVVAYYGMQKIAQKKRICWQSFSDYFQHSVNSELLGFVIAPLLNSDGRMSDALSSVSFLLSQDDEKTYQWVDFLQQQNQKRKEIQKKMTHMAMIEATKQYHDGKNSICIFLSDGHAGVHGISASRIKDAFGLPVILFSPKLDDEEVITGSARSIDRLNIKAVLDQIHQNHQGIMVKYGGHTGAAGLTIVKSQLEKFTALFDTYARQSIEKSGIETGAVIYTEGELQADELDLAIVDQITRLEPFGREFEAPVFCNKAQILAIRMVGKEAQHAQLQLLIEGKRIKGIWFFAAEYDHLGKINAGDMVEVAYRLTKEYFNGNTSLSLKVEYMQRI